MSSHHFVKEGQEPILVVLDSIINPDLIDQLIAWSPLMAATENSYEKLRQLGHRPDYLICSKKYYELIENDHIPKMWEMNSSEYSNLIHIKEFQELSAQSGYQIASSNSKILHSPIATKAVAVFIKDLRFSFFKSSYRYFGKLGQELQIIFNETKEVHLENLEITGHNNYRIIKSGWISVRCRAGFWIGRAAI